MITKLQLTKLQKKATLLDDFYDALERDLIETALQGESFKRRVWTRDQVEEMGGDIIYFIPDQKDKMIGYLEGLGYMAKVNGGELGISWI
jgi:hypothetical protein